MKKCFRRLGVFAIVAALEGGRAGFALAPGRTAARGSAGTAVGIRCGANYRTDATERVNSGDAVAGALHHQRRGGAHSVEPRLDIARVTGLASSQGWSDPELVPTFVGKPLDDILDLQFIATMPEQSQTAEGFVPIGAIFPLEPGHPFRGMRVRASENAVEVTQIPGLSQMPIIVNDCRDCVGKKFVERGQALPGAQGIVRQEDLPKVLSWVQPMHGIRGITHDPNRLNLILSGDNTIVAAYWE